MSPFNRHIFLSEYAKLLLKEYLQDIPDLPNFVVNKKTGEVIKINRNRLESNARYSGITPQIADQMHRLCMHDLWNPSEMTKKGIEAAYMYIISKNPEINAININLTGYDPLRSPMHDIVHGVASGIEPHNIAYFVQNLKGFGTRGNSSKGYITT